MAAVVGCPCVAAWGGGRRGGEGALDLRSLPWVLAVLFILIAFVGARRWRWNRGIHHGRQYCRRRL